MIGAMPDHGMNRTLILPIRDDTRIEKLLSAVSDKLVQKCHSCLRECENNDCAPSASGVKT